MKVQDILVVVFLVLLATAFIGVCAYAIMNA